ncbi:MAG: transposase [Victivallaceae bacterium]|nr:transposase [Victivallaceae bacterium]
MPCLANITCWRCRATEPYTNRKRYFIYYKEVINFTFTNLVLRAIFYGIITHRCHNREFLFKFAKHRDIYVDALYETSRRFKIDILDYIVTSNHVHLLLTAGNADDISSALQYLHGSVARKYNIAKFREGSFWANRFYATRIQPGGHLGTCLFYIDLNMIRAGVVKHPLEWRHAGIQELLGEKQRYCIINQKRLLRALDFRVGESSEFKDWYRATLNEKLACISHEREACWSEAIAVGDLKWIEDNFAKNYKSKLRLHPVTDETYYLYHRKKAFKNGFNSGF